MHLTGVSERITLNPGTSSQKTLLNVPDFNFHYQRGYDLTHWVKVVPGDKIEVSCTYPGSGDTRGVPPAPQAARGMWCGGTASSDEMCLGLISMVPVNPDATTNWTGRGHRGGHGGHLATPGGSPTAPPPAVTSTN